jgi:hypothetical protein
VLDHSTNIQIKANKQGIVEKFTSIIYILQQQPFTQKDIFHGYFVEHGLRYSPNFVVSGICWKNLKKKRKEKKGKVIGWGREGLNLQKLSSSLLVCPSASSANCAPDPGPPVPLKRMQVDVKVGGNGDEGDVWPGQR